MSINRWTDKEALVHVMYIIEYHSATKKEHIWVSLVKWVDLDPVIQSEVSQEEKNKYINNIYGI